MDKHLGSFRDLIGKAQSKGIVVDLFVADKTQAVTFVAVCGSKSHHLRHPKMNWAGINTIRSSIHRRQRWKK